MTTRVICDSSTLISLMEIGASRALEHLKEQAGIQFIIPQGVYEEIITHPLRIPRYAWGAVKLRRLVERGILTVEKRPGVWENAQTILHLANTTFFAEGRPLRILQEGEAECLALARAIDATLLAVDEKTTRLILEDPQRLRDVMANEHHRKITVDDTTLQRLKKEIGVLDVARSTELLALAARRGFFSDYGPSAQEAFHAAVQALRYAGCSISGEELDEYERVQA